jgi:GNAT superfamily N-acetyltransferase
VILREKTFGEYVISSDKSLLDIGYIHAYISEQSYWANGVPREIIEKSITHSFCFGVYHQLKQVGFARLVTDYATFGYLADVFIDEAHRGKGLSKSLMEVIFETPELHLFRRFLLATRDAHGLYEKFGFTPLRDPTRFMEKHQPEVYKKKN